MDRYKSIKFIEISPKDLARFIKHRERKAQIAVLKDIKPFGNGARIERLIRKIKEGTYKPSPTLILKTQRSSGPKEVIVTTERPAQSTTKQYMVVKK